MTEKQISEEDLEALARTIAMFEGGRMTYRPPGGPMQTVASEAGHGHFGEASENYSNANWKKYLPHASAAIQALHSRGWRRREDVLERFLYAIEWCAADSWDNCSECRARLEWAAEGYRGMSADKLALIGQQYHRALKDTP